MPEHIGWMIVGVVLTLNGGMMGLLVKTFIDMYKSHHEEDDET